MSFEDVKTRGNQVLAGAAMIALMTPSQKDDLAIAFLRDVLNQPSAAALWNEFMAKQEAG